MFSSRRRISLALSFHRIHSHTRGPGDAAQPRRFLPKASFIVLYCGCCPWNHCPNVGPAFKQLRDLGFTNVKVLYMADNLETTGSRKDTALRRDSRTGRGSPHLPRRGRPPILLRCGRLICGRALACAVFLSIASLLGNHALSYGKTPATNQPAPLSRGSICMASAYAWRTIEARWFCSISGPPGARLASGDAALRRMAERLPRSRPAGAGRFDGR